MRTIKTTIYTYDELSDRAKEQAREWYRNGAFDYDWWDFLYDDFEQRANELGITFNREHVPLMNGKTRSKPEIYFTGFYRQGSGSSFTGVWKAWDMNPEKLKSECPTDTELHRISNTIIDCANEDGEATASIRADSHSNQIHVEVESAKDIEADITQALRDFNGWIYQQLEKEWEWLNSDAQVAETIIANKYEFTEDGKRI